VQFAVWCAPVNISSMSSAEYSVLQELQFQEVSVRHILPGETRIRHNWPNLSFVRRKFNICILSCSKSHLSEIQHALCSTYLMPSERRVLFRCGASDSHKLQLLWNYHLFANLLFAKLAKLVGHSHLLTCRNRLIRSLTLSQKKTPVAFLRNFA
jgi:hypothetical protein